MIYLSYLIYHGGKMNYTDDVVTHIKSEGGIEYLKYKCFEKFQNLNVITTLRHGGYSKGVYNSLNVRTVGNDNIEDVFKNVKKISDTINIKFEDICKASQNHTDDILVLNENNKEKYKYENLNKEYYDAYITNSKNIASLVTTADCNPIIAYDPVNNVICNIHSGWKGTVKKIFLKAVKKMHDEFNSNYEDIVVACGPSIKKCCFSSEDEEFKKIFLDNFKYNEDEYIYYEDDKKRFHIDLEYLIKKDLINLGILEENIHFANICTMCNHENFYSYRYATSKKQEDYATFATIAYLK